jgi:hypothetical protein
MDKGYLLDFKAKRPFNLKRKKLNKHWKVWASSAPKPVEFSGYEDE